MARIRRDDLREGCYAAIQTSGGDEQLEVLRAIWHEMKALNDRIDGVRADLNGRIDGVRADLTTLRTELKAEIATLRAEMEAEDDALRRRLTESEVRVSTAVTELSGETRALASDPRVAR